MKHFKLWTALVTPFIQRHIDFASLERLVRTQNEAGNGLVLFGTTGEGMSLPFREKQAILEFVLHMTPSVPLLVSACDMVFNALIDWMEFCNPLPIAGYLCCVPPYTKPGPIGQYDWFMAILDKSAHPVMVYNNPGRTVVPLFEETLDRLKDHPNLWAFKDCSASKEQFLRYKSIAPALVMCGGDDNFFHELAPLGAEVLVSVASNAWPDEMRRYVEACSNGKAPSLEGVWKAFSGSSNPIPIKQLLYKLDLIQSPEVRLPLSSEDYHTPKALLEANALMTKFLGSDA